MTITDEPVRGRTTARRPNGRGSVVLRPDGKYDVRVSLPGRNRRRKIVARVLDETAAQHRRRAEAALADLQAQTEMGHTTPSGHVTVSRYADHWLGVERRKSDNGRGLAASTIDSYRQLLQYYVLPSLGSRPLQAVTLADVERMMDTLDADGRSPRTVQMARNSLTRLLKSALRDGLVSKVATDGASQIRRSIDRSDDPTSKALAPAAVVALFGAAEGTRWEPLLATLAYLGVRRGEALGLGWADVDFDAGIITVRRSLSRVRRDGTSSLVIAPTKTRASQRPLHAPPELLRILRAWRATQDQERLRCGAAWGNGTWLDADLVFTTPIGTPVDPDNLRHALARLARQAGVGHVYPHQLRHSAASLLIADGRTVPEVAMQLGHSSPAVTMGYYAHAFAEAGVRSSNTLASAYAPPGQRVGGADA